MIYGAVAWHVLLIVSIYQSYRARPRYHDRQPYAKRLQQEATFVLPGIVMTVVPNLAHLLFVRERPGMAALETILYSVWWFSVIHWNACNPRYAQLRNWTAYVLQIVLMFWLRENVY